MTEKERSTRRIEVIKDALKRLRYLNLSTNEYLRIRYQEFIGNECNTEQANKYISKIEKNCEVCAKGALFLSHIRKYNEVSVSDVLNSNADSYICSNLKEFDIENLDLVEAAYQCCPNCRWDDNQETKELDKKAVIFGQGFDYRNKKSRLKAILKNMLDNNGVFVPPPIPV